MTFRRSFSYFYDLLFTKNWEKANSPEQIEAREIDSSARFARGNVAVQHGAILTERAAKENMKTLIKDASAGPGQ